MHRLGIRPGVQKSLRDTSRQTWPVLAMMANRMNMKITKARGPRMQQPIPKRKIALRWRGRENRCRAYRFVLHSSNDIGRRTGVGVSSQQMGRIPAVFARIRHPPGVQNELRLVVEDGDDVEVQRSGGRPNGLERGGVMVSKSKRQKPRQTWVRVYGAERGGTMVAGREKLGERKTLTGLQKTIRSGARRIRSPKQKKPPSKMEEA
ncbi:hypothetical protein B0H13DRAFT_1873871 [Mycena leptocephala]|nr:hypothetical protein B0H13DRAFT_1873871 [Mycena leptocephala]